MFAEAGTVVHARMMGAIIPQVHFQTGWMARRTAPAKATAVLGVGGTLCPYGPAHLLCRALPWPRWM